LAEMQVASRLDPEKKLYRAREEELMKLMHASSAR
jgi:hypothetical protein